MKKFKLSIPISVVNILLLCLPSYAESEEETADQIHFSIISNTAITFDWTGTANHINYGTNSENLTSSVSAVNAEFLPVTSPWVSDPGPYWEAKLTGLTENTEYFYKIGSNGQVHSFRTPPVRGTANFRICSTSDMQGSTKECVAMFNQMAQMNPDIVITTGDLTGGDSGGQGYVVKRFQDAMAWSLSAAWMPCWGNHDWENSGTDDLRTYKGRFDLPNPQTSPSSPAVSCCGEDWGWFDYGNTRFISMPERFNSSTTWQDWAKAVDTVFSEAQNDPKIRFIVSYGHQSAYTSTTRRYPGSGTQQSILNGLHASYPKYRLDLTGHNHQYERYSFSSGITYIINSTAGSYYRGWADPTKPDNCNFRAIHYGILVLDFSEDAIHGKFVCSVGTSKTGSDYLHEEDVCDAPGSVIDEFIIYADSITAVGEMLNQVPDDNSLRNYPNPFHLSTNISYSLRQAGNVKIEVYDLLGRKIATLVDAVKERGEHTMEWRAQDGKGNDLMGGLYIAQICTNNKDRTSRLMLLQ
ncbi:metallophosphoesterase [Bacteroidota bacterium]